MNSTVIATEADLDRFVQAVAGKDILAVDCEGIDLSRVGKVTLVNVAVKEGDAISVFIFDMLHADKGIAGRQTETLKRLLEDEMVTKIFHDCRQDSDSLHKQYQIVIKNVYDTQVAHMVNTYPNNRLNLNNALMYYNCPINAHRSNNKVNYKLHPRYWENRPLTPEMQNSAAGDVLCLFELREAQLKKLSPIQAQTTLTKSEDYNKSCRDMEHSQVVKVADSKRGLVIGKGGQNIESIQRRTGTLIWITIDGFLVLAKFPSDLKKAEDEIKKAAAKTLSYYADF